MPDVEQEMSAFESIMRGLEEAKAYSKGQGADLRVHEVPIPYAGEPKSVGSGSSDKS